ncbi:DUF6864 domain-containing function [Citrobacter farmeri]|uniref:DUF6864 domain-containing function n=1 Tax=Citrobacter amalonaticus TaxID=35703 RepID=UPI001C979681|nr:hypothetical protein [Citrobacter amalonaticus]MBY5256403.1 hypothetical protein [Citrobacter amalonaticus]
MKNKGLIQNVVIGDRDVVDSWNFFISSDSSRLELELTDGKKFIIIFSYDADDQTTRYTGTPDGESYTLKLINFNNMFGEGITEPMAIVKVGSSQYYLTLWVQTNGDKSRLVNITITKD